MATRAESHFLGAEQNTLYFQKWSVPNAKGTLLITHGQGEHSGCYSRLIDGISALELNVYAWDLRGHGKSAGQRGYAQQFTDYCKDFELFLKKLTTEKEILTKPLFLLAHSMGGLIQSKVLVDHINLPVQAQVLSSPMFGLSLEVPAIKQTAARYISALFPKLTLGNEINFSNLSRDNLVIREFEHDVLRHDRISASVYLGSQTIMSEVMAKAARVKIPTLMQISNQDPITSSPAAREFFAKISSPKKKLIEYPGFKHELYNDLERELAFADIEDFLRELILA